jgi:hypothetical protein
MSATTPKNIDGRPNPAYVDLLDEDATIAGQKFVCVSFISPEKVIKQKELFFFERFVHQWEYAKTMEKFIAFLNFVSSKYHVDFEKLTEDFTEFVEEEKPMLLSYNADDDYKTFMDHQETKLTEEFSKKHAFTTNTRGLKVRGCFPSLEEAELRCKLLRANDPTHDVYVGPVGVWMPWDPEAYRTGRVEYMEEELNQLMSEKNKNEAHAKSEFDKRIRETKQQAISDNIKKAELSKNLLTQTIDESGNLVNITNMNTQETALTGSGEPVTTHDIEKILFEGDVVMPPKRGGGGGTK